MMMMISRDDYFRKSGEFRVWLMEEYSLNCFEIESSRARKYFDKFVRQWNSKRLREAYYERERDPTALKVEEKVTKEKERKGDDKTSGKRHRGHCKDDKRRKRQRKGKKYDSGSDSSGDNGRVKKRSSSSSSKRRTVKSADSVDVALESIAMDRSSMRMIGAQQRRNLNRRAERIANNERLHSERADVDVGRTTLIGDDSAERKAIERAQARRQAAVQQASSVAERHRQREAARMDALLSMVRSGNFRKDI
jgi:hypothetical protein